MGPVQFFPHSTKHEDNKALGWDNIPLSWGSVD